MLSLMFPVPRLFGPKVVSPKLITKPMLVLFDHKDVKVRKAGVDLCKELYRWMKDALKPAIQDLKPAMVTALLEHCPTRP